MLLQSSPIEHYFSSLARGTGHAKDFKLIENLCNPSFQIFTTSKPTNKKYWQSSIAGNITNRVNLLVKQEKNSVNNCIEDFLQFGTCHIQSTVLQTCFQVIWNLWIDCNLVRRSERKCLELSSQTLDRKYCIIANK